MGKKLVSVRDSKTEVFGAPVMCHNLADAERKFADLVADKASLVGLHPADFSLWCVGEFREESGAIDIENCPFVVAAGKDFINGKE